LRKGGLTGILSNIEKLSGLVSWATISLGQF